MKTCVSLPESYEEGFVLDLMQDRKTLVLISVLSFILTLLLFVLCPVSALFLTERWVEIKTQSGS